MNQTGALALAWRLIAWAFVSYLWVLGILIFMRPRIANRFLEAFAGSERVNLLEATLRLIAGLAFIAVSPETKLPVALFGLGAVLAVSAVMMAFLYRAHKRYAGWAIPFAKRILPLMGVAAFALGALIAWALS
ncbi:MAG: hypothetical protein HC869_15740 [Rhodospirillales bacterium]|nr:hypothetical protein [Rhodospirillales bacterium]